MIKYLALISVFLVDTPLAADKFLRRKRCNLDRVHVPDCSLEDIVPPPPGGTEPGAPTGSIARTEHTEKAIAVVGAVEVPDIFTNVYSCENSNSEYK